MGQSSSSCPKPHDKNSYTLQNPFSTVEETYHEDNPACCLYKVRRSPIKKDLNWKDYMLDQFRLVDSEAEWPSILSKQLAIYQDPLTDTNYRIKVVEAKLSRPRTDISSNEGEQLQLQQQSETSQLQHQMRRPSNPFAVNTVGMGNSSRMLASRRDAKDVNTSIKQLLDTSDILDEKIYPACYKDLLETIKGEQRTRNNISGLPDLSKYSNELNVTRGADYTTRNFQAYQNNTILSQLGPVYRMQQQHGVLDQDAVRTEACLLYYKQVTSIIESHLKQEKNIFRKFIGLFESYFSGKYQNIGDEIQDMEQLVTVIQSATKDLQQFIRILCDGIGMYYELPGLQRGKLTTGHSIFSYDNMSNFITTIVFNDRIYRVIFDLYELENYQTEQNYQKQLSSLQKLSPQDFGITEEYCLDEQTVDFFKKKETIPEEQRNILGLEPEPFLLEQSRISGFADRQDPYTGNIIGNKSEKLKKKPYSKAISALKALSYQKSPIHKSKSILKTIEMMGVSIDEFYEEFGIKSQRSLTGDHTFNILCYVIVNSGIGSVLSHCRVINEFSTSNMMSSISGYYASTLEVCVQYLCNLPVQENEIYE